MTSPASADSDFSPAGKRQRERRYHTVTVPSLRLVGFAMITALIAFRQQFVHDPGGWPRMAAIAAGFLAYNAITWIALRHWFGRVGAINLGDAYYAYGRPKEALSAVSIVPNDHASPYGVMQAEEVRAVAVNRLGPRLGELQAAQLSQLDEALRLHLQL